MSNQPSSWGRRAAETFGTLFIVLGTLLVAATGALYAYGQYERHQFELETAATAVAESSQPTATLNGASSLLAAATALPSPSAIADLATPSRTAAAGLSSPSPTGVPSATATETPTPTPTPALPPTRILIPAIKLDSKVVESPVQNGEWKVPKFVAGHLEGTANPGENGNVALSGHIQSISSGNVFADIGQLDVGDEVFLQAGAAWFRYVVGEKKAVPNSDVSVLASMGRPTLTLITCTGIWDPVSRDYDQRLVVIADLARPEAGESVPRPSQPD